MQLCNVFEIVVKRSVKNRIEYKMIPRVLPKNLPKNQIRYLSKSHEPDSLNLSNSENNVTVDISRQSRDRELKNLLESSSAFIDTKPQNSLDKWATLPYAEGTVISKRKGNELDIERPRIDPRDTSIIIFPGDEAIFKGMAKSLDRVPAAKDVFDYASEVVKYIILCCTE